MGICLTGKDKKLRTINNYQSYSNININQNVYIAKLNDINVENSSSPKINNPNVYKISRKLKKNHKKYAPFFLNINTIKGIKHTHSNSTTNSKSRNTTETSTLYLSSQNSFLKNNNRFNMNSDLQTIDELQSQSSLNLPHTNNRDNILHFQTQNTLNNGKNNFKGRNKELKKRLYSSYKELPIIAEESSNKLYDKEKILANGINNKSNKNINNYLGVLNESYFKCIKTISDSHKDKIVCMTELFDGKIATGSYDNTIKIWNLNSFNNNCEKTITEEGNVFCLIEFENNMLLSGTNKNNINLFNLNNKKNNNIFSFKGHKLWVTNLVKLNNKYFASSSNDNQIRIWDYYNKICSNILIGHADGVLSVTYLSDGQLCSGGADLSIKIWDWTRGICTSTLLGHKKWIKCLHQLSNKYILSGSDDKTIKVWFDNKCINTLVGHTKSVRTLCQINNYSFASGSFDKTIKIWDILKFNCIQTIYAHKDLILNLIRKRTGEIISCSNDSEIKIWKQRIS
jgi:WD40 repeat protein